MNGKNSRENKIMRVLAAALVLCMLFTCTNVSGTLPVLAAEDTPTAQVDEHGDHNGWTKWTGEETQLTLTGGNYYLESPVTLTSTLRINGDVSLCLNGNELKYTGTGSSAVTVNGGANFHLYDCGNTGKLTGHAEQGVSNGGVVCVGGAFTMHGGTISGSKATYGGGVYVNSGTFTMEGGTISGNTASVDGGGVFVNTNGTFTMNSGTISGNKASNCGGGVCNYGTFEMKNGTISNNTATNGSGGGVINYGTFTMNSGTISSNTTTNNGGGVYVSGGTFEMSGGTIGGSDTTSGNKASSGGGVYVNSNGTFNMSGGSISGNTATNGGGVYVNTNGKFNMNGGKISNNTTNTASNSGGFGGGVYSSGTFNMSGSSEISNNTAKDQGGGVSLNGGTFTMENGTISGNTSNVSAYGGGGVYVVGNGTFTMKNGTISGNKVTNANGGGVYLCGGKFTMENGTISGNTAKYGGGVYVYSGTFTMNSGTISGNTANSSGGGVYVNSGTFTMNSGTISSNTAANNGGGVYVNTDGEFTMTGGTISGNTATNGNGGGVYNNGTFTINGTVNITGNKKSDGSANNVYLPDGKIITLGISYNTASTVGVTTAKSLSSCNDSVAITETTQKAAVIIQSFLSDNADYTIKYVASDAVKLFGKHSWGEPNGSNEVTCTSCSTTGKGGTCGAEGSADSVKWLLADGVLTISGNGAMADYPDSTAAPWNQYEGNISKVIIKDGVTSIGNYAFSVCTGLKSITIPSGVTSIGDCAFNGCTGLKSITIPSGVTTIGNDAFYGCQGLTSITIPSGVTEIGYNAFMNCSNLATIEFTSTSAPHLRNTSVFANCNKLTTIIVPCSWDKSALGDNWSSVKSKITQKEHIWNADVTACTVCGATPHKHKVCSDTNCSNHSDIIWKAWDKTDSLPTTTGNYYLTNNVNASSLTLIAKGNTVSLCLNGKTVTSGTDGIIKVLSGANFTLCDCGNTGTLTGNNNNCWGVYVDNGGTFNMYGGTITGCNATSYNGGGVFVNGSTSDISGSTSDISGGTFNMYGGTISGNTATNGGGVFVHGKNTTSKPGGTFNMYGGTIEKNTTTNSGGGVYVNNRGTFTMYGGTISGNTATSNSFGGGGVFVNNVGTFTMSGGTISGNNATNGNGGGVFVAANSKFEMSGGTITNNGKKIKESDTATIRGGGVYVDSNGEFTMSGSSMISGNTATKQGGGVYVNGGTFTMDNGTISENKATDNDSSYNENGGGVYVASSGTFTMNGGTILENTADGFSGGVFILGTFKMSGSSKILNNTAASQGGGVCVNGGTFEMSGSSTISGNTSNVTAFGGGGVYVTSNGKFTMNNGTISENKATNANGGGVYVSSGTFEMKGGTIGGTSSDEGNSAELGGGVFVEGGTFSMTGGKISANTTSVDGGGVYTKGTFTMSGESEISDNTATASGGGVYVVSTGKFTMNSGTISGNKANGTGDEQGGGGVFVNNFDTGSGINYGQFEMTGGTISGNTAAKYGGGVYSKGTFTMSGNSTISSNTANSGGGVFVISSGSFNMSGGSTISGNNANSGGGVYVNLGGSFTMSSGEISDNTITYYGGGVYVGGDFTLNGSVNITGNKKSDNSANNVYLPSDKTITFGENFNLASTVGVTAGTPPTDCTDAAHYVSITSITADPINDHNFSSDDDKYAITIMRQTSGSDTESYLSLGGPHEWNTDGTCTKCHTTRIGGNCGADPAESVKWALANNTLTITGNGAMADYDNDTPAPWHDKTFSKVVINEGVTSIGNSAFYSCTGLTSVEIPSSVESIGENAFESCTGLTSITIPSKVTSIGATAFGNCTNLATVEFKGAKPTLGTDVFTSCNSITSIIVPCGWGDTDIDTLKTKLSYTGTVNQKAHTLTKVDGVDPTETTTGIKEHWKCSVCEKLFSDDTGATETTLEEVTLPATAAKPLPDDKPLTDCVTLPDPVGGSSGSSGNLYNGDITITPKDGWLVGTDPESLGSTPITISEETDNGKKTIYLKDPSGNIYTTDFTYKLDKTAPTVTESSLTVGDGGISFTAPESGKAYWIVSETEPTAEYVKQNGNVQSITSGETVSLPVTAAETAQKVYIVLEDEAGNLSGVVQKEIPAQTEEHTHTYDTAWSKDETYHWHAATCEHTTEVKDKATHNWDGGVVTTAATETTPGVRTYTCTVCTRTKTETIPALGHTHTYSSSWTTDYYYHWHAATCGHSEVSGMASHSWGSGVVTTEATCTQNGERTYTCGVCGDTKTEEIPLANHTLTYFSAVEPTETTEGNVEHWHCSGCGKNFSDASGNTEIDNVTIPPTEAKPLPDDKPLTDCVTLPTPIGGSSGSSGSLYGDSITITPKDGWTVGLSPDATGGVNITEETGPDGKTVTIYLKDPDGNLYQTEFNYKLDTTPPTVDPGKVDAGTGSKVDNKIIGKKDTVIKIPASGITDKTSDIAEVSYKATTDGGVEVTGGTLTATNGNYEIALDQIAAGGDFVGTIELTVKDSAGHTSTVTLPANGGKIIVEEHLPVVKPTAQPSTDPSVQPNEKGWYSSNFDLTVTVTDNEDNTGAVVTSGGIARIEWKDETGEVHTVTGVTGSNTTETFTIPTSDGEHTYYVNVVDNAGNSSGWREYATVKVDSQKPAFSGDPAVDGGNISFTPTESGKAYWIISDTEPTAEQIKQNGTALEITSGTPVSLPVTAGGTAQKVYVVLEDDAGNLSNVVKTEISAEHTHTFSTDWATDGEYHWHAATCGHDVVDSKAAHNWNSGVVTIPATETTEGVKTYTCTTCGQIKTEPVAMLEHTHTFSADWAADGEYHWHAATCGHTTEVSGKAAHNWNSGEITTQPTEATEGIKTYTCTVCGQIKTETVARLEHMHTPSNVWTSDASGHWHSCTGCTEKLDFAAHVEDGGTVTAQPTATTAGAITFKCTVCSYVTRTESISPIGGITNPGGSQIPSRPSETSKPNDTTKPDDKDDTDNKDDKDDSDKTDDKDYTDGTDDKNDKDKTDSKDDKDNSDGKDKSDNKDDKDDTDKSDNTDKKDDKDNSDSKDDKDDSDSKDDKDKTDDKDDSDSKDDTSKPDETDNTDGTDDSNYTGDSDDSNDTSKPDDTSDLEVIGNKSKEVKVDKNVPKTKIPTPLDDLIDAVTPKREQIKESDTVKIVLRVKDAEKTVTAEDKRAVDEFIEQMDGFKLAQYLDISLFEMVNDHESKITSTGKPITVMFEIPENLRKDGRRFAVIRVHENETTVFNDLDDDPNTVTIKTDRFSTYALVYTEKVQKNHENNPVNNSGENPANNPVNNSGENPANIPEEIPKKDPEGISDENPATGIAVSFIPLLVIAAVAVATIKRKKK